MSKRKQVRPNYQQLYRESQNANWGLQQRLREEERKNERQEIIANQMARTESRVRQDLTQIRNQVAQAEKKAAGERAQIHQMQRQALQDIAGVRVDLRVTQERIQNMQWENQELHRLATEDRQQIKDQIEQARRENLEWHRIAEQQRQRIQAEVQRNAQLIDRNREEILENREALNRGFEQVMHEMDRREERQKLEQMRTAAQIMETGIAKRSGIPTEWMERFEPVHYRHAADLMEKAEGHFRRGEYPAAAKVAEQALNHLTTVAKNVDEKHNEYQRAREEAYRVYDQLLETFALLDTDEMRLWYGGRYQELKGKIDQLDKVASAEDYADLRVRSTELLAEAKALEQDLADAVRRHFERRSNAKMFVKALAGQHDYRPLKPIFENEADPHSDILLQTEEGLTMRLALKGDVLMEFPDDDVEKNSNWMEEFDQICQRQDFAQINYERTA